MIELMIFMSFGVDMNMYKTYASGLCGLLNSHPLVGSIGIPFGLVGFIGACSPGALICYFF